MTHEDRVVAALRAHAELDDDELSAITGISPRQSVNQACRRLEQKGVLVRLIGPLGKITNRLTLGFPHTTANAQPSDRHIDLNRSTGYEELATDPVTDNGVNIDVWRSTMFVIPCSGWKVETDIPCRYSSIADQLPNDLRERLHIARSSMVGRIGLDERTLAPACQRYAGSLYQSAATSIRGAIDGGLHILIVSGGYGLLHASDPIGIYDARFHSADWPKALLEDCLLAYATRNRLTSMRAFMASSTDYGKLIRRVPWIAAGIQDAWLMSPEATTGAMVKTPRALGEAFGAQLAGRLAEDWRSSDGLRIIAESLGSAQRDPGHII